MKAVQIQTYISPNDMSQERVAIVKLLLKEKYGSIPKGLVALFDKFIEDTIEESKKYMKYYDILSTIK
jgi:hypothetical protein